MFKLVLGVLLVMCANAQQCSKNVQYIAVVEEDLSAREGFKAYQIIDTDIPVAPQYDLQITLGSKKIPIGSVISPILTYGISPKLACKNVEEGKNYTVVLLDIDWPSSKDKSQRAYINSITVNNPSDNLNSGDIVVPYTPAVPKLNSGYHRYVGLLYKQSHYINAEQTELLHLARKKEGFKANQFAEKYGLGDPFAGAFFFAQFTEC